MKRSNSTEPGPEPGSVRLEARKKGSDGKWWPIVIVLGGRFAISDTATVGTWLTFDQIKPAKDACERSGYDTRKQG